MDTALFELSDVRVDVDGVPTIDGLSATTGEDRVLILGAARALFEAMSGARDAARGAVRIAGESPRMALASRLASAAPLDPPLPPKWTPLRYATWASRLAGHARRDAAALAAAALAPFSLGDAVRAPLAKALPHVRRAAVLAGALSTEAGTILLEDPTLGLPDHILHPFAATILRALEGRRWAVFASRASLASPLFAAATDALVIEGSQIALQGAPAALASLAGTYSLRLRGPVEEVARRYVAHGATVERAGDRLIVDLGGSLTTTDLFAGALAEGALIVELRSLSSAIV